MAERLPVADFNLSSVRFSLSGIQLSSGQSISGFTQTAKTDGGGFWTAQLSCKLRTADQVRSWRAYGARLDGGAATIEVPRCEAGMKPTLTDPPEPHQVPHSDDATFSDGSEYAFVPGFKASFGGPAALRATQVQIDFTEAVDVLGGEVFTAAHATAGARMYVIHSVVSQTGNIYTVKIRPPLREAVTTSTPLDFDYPRCLMRLANPDSWDAPLANLRFSDPAPVFIEHFDPQAAS